MDNNLRAFLQKLIDAGLVDAKVTEDSLKGICEKLEARGKQLDQREAELTRRDEELSTRREELRRQIGRASCRERVYVLV